MSQVENHGITDFKEIISRVEKFIENKEEEFSMPDVMLRRCLNETWFSDTLAWLLDPKTDDELGVLFINNFIKKVAEKRSSEAGGYKRRDAFLRFRDQKAGRSVTGDQRFSLKNAAVMREFYLSNYDSRKRKSSAQFADIAVFDLDPGDGIFLTIENKLFSRNHPGQLENYYKLIEDKFKSVKVREYIYLTITGEEPVFYKKNDSSDEK
ncbi:PD-(D/E)XK nuclease family protein [Chitinivibrio alkaliphilus]|uniref:Uncharacterized protein n=1 Tax=Chitinivibrio alkaliphilus ACht1 TaxID=1313304 RepID=U7D424_9BACT|nr:PD-(D/E)XK nuclease family protein [Chitinivibrio alkaliphilus]ERP30703.1 hypothetical protein CALK_2483 [Chitinivibrio alkaliphilus ACht1]